MADGGLLAYQASPIPRNLCRIGNRRVALAPNVCHLASENTNARAGAQAFARSHFITIIFFTALRPSTSSA
jgi:hypothetical protein